LLPLQGLGGRMQPDGVFLLHPLLAAGAGGQPAKAPEGHITTPAQDRMGRPGSAGPAGRRHPAPSPRRPPPSRVAGRRLRERLVRGQLGGQHRRIHNGAVRWPGTP
jgi:hypothetical protein